MRGPVTSRSMRLDMGNFSRWQARQAAREARTTPEELAAFEGAHPEACRAFRAELGRRTREGRTPTRGEIRHILIAALNRTRRTADSMRLAARWAEAVAAEMRES